MNIEREHPGSPDYINTPAWDEQFVRLLHDLRGHLDNILHGAKRIGSASDTTEGPHFLERVLNAADGIDRSRAAMSKMIDPFQTMLIVSTYPRFGVRTSSFRGITPGARHWRATAWFRFEGQGAELQEVDVTFCLTEKQAAMLSEPDFEYKRGYITNRCFSLEQAVDAGVKALIERFGDEIVVEHGGYVHADNRLAYNGKTKARERVNASIKDNR